MLKVSEEVVALRTESDRVMQQKLLQGAALNSQAANATAQQYDAKALLLQSQLDFLQANDELLNAIGPQHPNNVSSDKFSVRRLIFQVHRLKILRTVWRTKDSLIPCARVL